MHVFLSLSQYAVGFNVPLSSRFSFSLIRAQNGREIQKEKEERQSDPLLFIM